MAEIRWSDFERVELRAGTIVSAEPFPEARVPAYKLLIDFGTDIGRPRFEPPRFVMDAFSG